MIPRETATCDRCRREIPVGTYQAYHGLCGPCWRTPRPAPCSCHLMTPGEACEACWASHLADLDANDGWPDEAPETPDAAWFDRGDLAEMFEPSADDEAARLAWQTKGGA
jgi:hypothetical protein